MRAQPIDVPTRAEPPFVEEKQHSVRVTLPSKISIDDSTFTRVRSA